VNAPRPKSCTVCGTRTPDGGSRCPKHLTGSGRMQPCMVCSRPSMGRYCAAHEPKVDEALRNARNPYRRAYTSNEYRVNRQHRYERARGKCERCGIEVGPGQWQCDHIVSARMWESKKLPGSPNQISNLQILCTVPRADSKGGCHGMKTRSDRRL
jgi:5-methylcytosine-specific restriction endonuclease McrA